MPTDHLSDEDLSALLDGEGGASTHVRQCAQCRARVEQLRAVALAVGTPVALPAHDVREAAIARAVSVRGASARPGHSRERWAVRFRRPLLAGGAALTAAAAVAAFVVMRPRTETKSQAALKGQAAGAATSSTGGGQAYTAGGYGSARTESAGAGTAAGGGAIPPALGTATDLGDVPDGAALRARVGPAVHRSGTSEQHTAAARGGTPNSAGAPTPMAAPAAAPQQDSSASTAEVPPPYSGPPPPCEATARALGQTRDRLIYVASAKWQGTPATVLAFVPEPPSTGPVRVYVMEQGTCRVLFSDAYDQ